MTLGRVVPRMTRRTLLLAPLLLLGTIVAVSGPAAALYPPGATLCAAEMDHRSEGPVDPIGIALYGLAYGRAVTNNVLDFAHETLPDHGVEDPTASMAGSNDRICVNFLSICGPIVSAVTDRV